MKIGTDGVLLGAWANVENGHRLLDVGTGCGLIALMLAQRTERQMSIVDAIEVDALAAEQANDNVARSPWSTRVTVFPHALQRFVNHANTRSWQYDRIVCNPPFFQDSLPAESVNRSVARHADSLSRETLFGASGELLKPNGMLAIILPFDQLKKTHLLANGAGFHLCRQTSVRPLPGRPFKRVLLEFVHEACPTVKSTLHDELTVEQIRHQFTDQYRRLTKDFHLRYAREA